MAACHYCGIVENEPGADFDPKRELRPYGPGGARVCYACAFATPEREAQTAMAFAALLDANAAMSPTGIVAIGESDGPRPFDPREPLPGGED